MFSSGTGGASKRRLGLLPLVAATYFMVSGGPYGIEDILGGAGYRDAVLILLLLPLIWSIPTSLMIGELASALPEEGGFYTWVRRAFGPFWGYQEAWLSLTASIFDMAIYPTIFVLYLGKMAPVLTVGHRGVWWALSVVVLCCLWNLRGAHSVGWGAIALFVALLLPFLVLTFAGYVTGALHLLHGFASSNPPPHSLSATTAVLVAMWNYMGWDNASTVAQEVEQPQRDYPRAMIGTAVLVCLTYVIPLSAIAAAGVPVDRFATGSWTDAARILGGPLLAIAVAAGGMINGLGMFNALTLSYTRLPMVLAEDGLLPASLAHRNRRGSPSAAILVCGVGWALALGFSFERLISLDLMLYGASLMLEFAALLALRVREPRLTRPFRIPGGFIGASLVSAGPCLLILYAIYAARDERMAHMPAILFGLMIAAGGPVCYLLSRNIWRRDPNRLGAELPAAAGDTMP